MNRPEIKGFCPGALRPMMSGDGLVVRIRPYNGRLSHAQVQGIAALSQRYGNGFIDLSSRANVQLRGVTRDTHGALIEGLRSLSLIDPSEAVESRRNIIVTPFGETNATSLTEALTQPDAPELPHKFGFAVDTGPKPVLQTAPADIRLERDATGGLILVAEGMTAGKPVAANESIQEALTLAQWFMDTRGTHNRMAQLLADGKSPPADFTTARQTQTYQPAPGLTPHGMLAGIAFGQITAGAFSTLGDIRLTPWRMILLEGVENPPRLDGLITDPADPLLRIIACTGAPGCTQALNQTRPIARSIAAYLKPFQTLHISGCAKGCAHPKPAPLTLTATENGFDLVKQGRAGDTPAATSLSTDDIIKALSHAP
ncbi:precorrin-3B synthase [Sulfitobacter sp. F26204]|uniref:precorrin-3B synthase n=1 Tax=Sulfitobacter sp. F26204 TaxID=2996014 RepID=UPI00225DD0BF|nr:precorrin-3B synthase [Sulfitobacter sp. F26204]MCX7558111.1 precorrin-3B synthase [Sulfitobacter sp. F26204]